MLFRSATVVILLGGSAGVAIWLTMTSPIPTSSERPEEARRVSVMEVSPREIGRTWNGYGLAEAMDSADVPVEVPSIVLEVPDSVQIGRRVSVGDLIAVLDAEDFQRQYEIAERMLREISTNLEQLDIDETNAQRLVQLGEQDLQIVREELVRIQKARENGAANPREVDLVRQRVVQSETALTSVRERLQAVPIRRRLLENQQASQRDAREIAARDVERCRVVSPITGVLETVEIELGERVVPGQRIARVVDLTRMTVELRLPSSARPSVFEGNDVRITARGSKTRLWNGTVNRISPVDDPLTRTMTAFVELDQVTESSGTKTVDFLAPGTFVVTTVYARDLQKRVIVPQAAVRQNRLWFVLDDNVVRSVDALIAFPIESEGGRLRELALDNELPSGARVLLDASRTPSVGSVINPEVIDLVANEEPAP
jgi:multidrug resistance efflux pump